MANEKGQITNNDLQNTAQKTKDQATRILLKPGMNSGAPEGLAVPAPHMAPVVLLLLQTWWLVMNEERTGLWLRQKKHIYGHLWHRYYVTVN